MISSKVLTFLFLLFFITLVGGEKKKTGDKIIIHVPYKIHNHHHTHTKYKVIRVPEPKHEKTIIYLKENQPEPKPEVQPQVQHLEESNFVPPHQESAAHLLDHLQQYKEQPEGLEEEQKLSHITTDQKPLETNQNFIPNYEFQPMIVPTHENVIPHYSFKPVLVPEEQMFASKYVINPMHYHHQQQQHNFIPNYEYQTYLHHSPQIPQQIIPQYAVQQKLPVKIAQDSVAHSTSQEYNMVMKRKPRSGSYKVREEVQEDHHGQFYKHPLKINKIVVPSLKSNVNGKSYLKKHSTRSVAKLVPADPNYEYEHVGYLLIDGNSRKIVGKNFKDEIHLTR